MPPFMNFVIAALTLIGASFWASLKKNDISATPRFRFARASDSDFAKWKTWAMKSAIFEVWSLRLFGVAFFIAAVAVMILPDEDEIMRKVLMCSFIGSAVAAAMWASLRLKVLYLRSHLDASSKKRGKAQR